MSESEPWYVTRRAEVLAELALTRRPGVRLSRPSDLEGADLLVSVEHPAHLFGVEVKGVLGIDGMVSDGRFRADAIAASLDRARDYPFPVLLVAYDLRDDSGYWGWLLKPERKPGALEWVREPLAQPISEAAVDAFLDEVANWYGARVLQAA